MDTDCNMCGGVISAPEDVVEGEILSCPDCGIEFEIRDVVDGKLVLRAAEEIKEDWGE